MGNEAVEIGLWHANREADICINSQGKYALT